MGSYGICWLDSLEVGSSINDIDPFLMCLFNSSDKQVFDDISDELPEKLAYRWEDDYADDEDYFMVCYITDIGAVKDRLEISGYTLETCEEIFYLAKQKEIEKYCRWSQGSKTSKLWQDRIKILKDISYDAWINNIVEINNNPDKYKTDIFKSEKADSLLV